MKKSRLYFLDLWRVIAIVLVLGIHILREIATFYHPKWITGLSNYFGIPNFFWITLAGAGVVIFIILSGMVLEYTYGDEKYNYFSFIYKRLKRIYLTYWLCLALAIFLIGSVANFWLNASGFMLFTGEPWKNFTISTAWFLGLILVLYLLYPLFSFLLKKSPYLTLLVLLIISIIARFMIADVHFWHRGIDSFPLSRVFEFGLGIFLIQRAGFVKMIDKMSRFFSSKSLVFISDISFPIFLIHPIFLKLKIISIKDITGTVIEFLVLTIGFSVLVYYLEKKIAKFQLVRRAN